MQAHGNCLAIQKANLEESFNKQKFDNNKPHQVQSKTAERSNNTKKKGSKQVKQKYKAGSVNRKLSSRALLPSKRHHLDTRCTA